jgi:hypothetical protein
MTVVRDKTRNSLGTKWMGGLIIHNYGPVEYEEQEKNEETKVTEYGTSTVV